MPLCSHIPGYTVKYCPLVANAITSRLTFEQFPILDERKGKLLGLNPTSCHCLHLPSSRSGSLKHFLLLSRGTLTHNNATDGEGNVLLQSCYMEMSWQTNGPLSNMRSSHCVMR